MAVRIRQLNTFCAGGCDVEYLGQSVDFTELLDQR